MTGSRLNSKQWQPAEDARIRELYAVGEAWGTIAKAFGVTRAAAIARGHRTGCNWRAPLFAPRPQQAQRVGDPRLALESTRPPGMLLRPPLPPGHPTSWGLVAPGMAWPRRTA